MLELKNLQKSFGGVSILQNISLTISQGEFISILGPSGCGKTTLLRILAGFESLDSGDLRWNDNSILNMRPNHRPFNLVFQRYALFPHMNVEQNVAFGPTIRGEKSNVVKSLVFDALKLVCMQDFAHRRIETLSGGQQQRVALARAIINNPQVLLLDEPMSALDKKLREKMRLDLMDIQKKMGITFILVTHDQDEAMGMSDRIAIMNEGEIVQVGKPKDLYLKPKTAFVADFIGSINVLYHEGRKINIRPEDLRLTRDHQQHGEFEACVPVVLCDILFRGAVTHFVLESTHGDGEKVMLEAQVPSSWHHDFKINEKIYMRWSRSSVHDFEHRHGW